jgi:hypothetical protein
MGWLVNAVFNFDQNKCFSFPFNVNYINQCIIEEAEKQGSKMLSPGWFLLIPGLTRRILYTTHHITAVCREQCVALPAVQAR